MKELLEDAKVDENRLLMEVTIIAYKVCVLDWRRIRADDRDDLARIDHVAEPYMNQPSHA